MPESAERWLLVAEIGGEAAAFGRVKHAGELTDWTGGPVPRGWYLTGVIVGPAFRRRGIGAELTRRRLAWVAERADEAFYFASARNLSSIDLHAQFGFREVKPDFAFPGATFTGGRGVMF